jgi:cysteinyl-tRNA synthetase
MTIRIHNTLTGRIEPFTPIDPNSIRMYVCGITPYDVCHLGHARCYVVFDVARRALKANGYKVRFVQNFTDVDDKIIARAKERGIKPSELARENIEDFFSKMDALGVERADVYPKVTDHIPDIIALIRKLVDQKVAYPLRGDVYFSVKAFPPYGKLSKRPLEELQSGTRIDVDKEKHDALDFALWKESKPKDPPEVSWDSPWGKGRPGWHIECSVMAMKHLGVHFDIHGGGLDLIFPHHENEIAQSEAATHQPFANVWMHNGFVTLDREKMSKSLGNFFTLSEIFAKYHPSVVRYMLLTVHYRAPLDFSTDILEQSRQALSGLRDAMARANRVLQKHTLGVDESDQPLPEVAQAADGLVKEFNDALIEDFNTPEALGLLHQLVKLLEKQFNTNTVSRGSVRYTMNKIRLCAEVLGIDLFSFLQGLFIPPEVTELAQKREAARQSKNWKEADRLRADISAHGYVVEDTAQGPRLLPKASA